MKIDNAKIKLSDQLGRKTTVKQRVSSYSEVYKSEYYNIDIGKLIPFQNQSRKSFDPKSLEELSQTIKMYGIRQPLTVVPSKDIEGRYEIISGERRWRAAQIAGISKIPCIILHNNSIAEEIALVENVQRKDLHPIELMHGLQSLLDKGVCKNHQDITNKIGISRTVVVEILRLSKLPLITQDLLLENEIKSRDFFRQLLKAPEEHHKKMIVDIKSKESTSVTEKQKTTIKKTKLLSIHIQNEQIIFDKIREWALTAEQRERMQKYLQDLLQKL